MDGRKSRPALSASHVGSLLGAFVAASTVLGLLAAGMLMPIVGLGGATTKEVVTAFDSLPAQFTAAPVGQQSRILASDGALIATLYEENRIVVPISKISKPMQQAQIAIEDKRFYEHGGVDGRGLLRAVISTAQGDKQGASTLTQQYVRQMLVETARQREDKAAAEAAMARGGIAGLVRKIQEAKYAISMEQRLTKDRILEGYLNITYYGAGAYGVEAAARRYFDIPASKLNVPQAALIAGLAQNPGVADPINHPERALARRNAVLAAMQKEGFIGRRAAQQAVATPLGLKVTQGKPSCPASPVPYVCEYVVKWLLEQPALGKDEKERRKRLYFGGLTVKTSFDLKLVNAVNDALAARVPPRNSRSRGAAAAVVEPGTGRVLAIGQNTTWGLKQEPGKTSLNWAVDRRYGASEGFQLGSTVKAFALVTALEQGMTAGSRIYAPPDATRYSASRLGAHECGMPGTSYAPYNAEGEEHGLTTLQVATAMSINTAFLDLAARVGVCKEKETMKRMGLIRADGEDYGQGLAATILGADNASPLTLASAYATLASGGTYCAPRPVDSIVVFDGSRIPVGENNCRPAVDPKVAYDATRILTTVMTSGTGKALGLSGRVSAGKTGTADNGVETWFAGYTPQRAAAVWYGTPYDQRGTGVYGATIAGPLWTRIMNRAHQGLPAKRFSLIRDGERDTSDEVQVPNVVGWSRAGAERRLKEAGLSADVAQQRVTSENVRWGRVARMSPGAGETVSRGETILLTLSRGDGSPATKTTSSNDQRRDGTDNRRPSPSPTRTRPGDDRTGQAGADGRQRPGGDNNGGRDNNGRGNNGGGNDQGGGDRRRG